MKHLLRVVAFILCSNTFVHAQTIADLARQERARRQGAPKATITVTTKDLKTEASAPKTEVKPEGEPAAPPTAAAAPAPETPPAAGPGGHDEKWWRGQFEKTREEIQRLSTQIPLLESDFNTANREFLTRSYDPDGRGKRAIEEAKARVDLAKGDLAKAQGRLTQIEDDLRRAGGPAGWAR